MNSAINVREAELMEAIRINNSVIKHLEEEYNELEKENEELKLKIEELEKEIDRLNLLN